MPKQKLPKQIYVKREADQNDPTLSYLIANERADEMEHGDTVGIYELREVRTMRVSHELK